MGEQIHKRLINEQVTMILDRYNKKELTTDQAMDLLCLKRRQFFEWAKRYRDNPEHFSIEYQRKEATRALSDIVEEYIISELKAEKGLIDDPGMSVRFYNYSYIQDQLQKKYGQKVSLPTIIDRAKKKDVTSQNLRKKLMTVRCSPIT